MGNNIVPIAPAAGAVQAYIDQHPNVMDRLGAGIQPSFAVLSILGKEWSIKYRGEITPLYRDNTREPLQTIELVIVDAAPHLSRTYYEDDNKYTAGSAERPDCASIDGVIPDPGVKKQQSPICATCEKAKWGSRITQQGKRAKACQENKRLVVTNPKDIENEDFGGPMLLRVPVMSHGDLQAYSMKLKQAGVPVFAVATRIGFQAGVAHPQLTFTYGGTLDEEVALQAIQLIDDPRTLRILAEGAEYQGEGEAAPPAPAITPTSLSQKAIDAAIARAQGSKPAPAEAPAAKTDFVAEAKHLAEQALAMAGPSEPAPAPTPVGEPAPAPQAALQAAKKGFGGSAGPAVKPPARPPAKPAEKPTTPAAPASFDTLMDGLLETQG